MTTGQIVPFRCEQCGGQFQPHKGGICSRCRRLLCSRHLSRWRRGEPMCDRCRREVKAGKQ